MDKGCHVQETVQFSGKNTGPEIVIPIMPLACQVLLGETQDCSRFILLIENGNSNCPCQVSRAL